MTDSLAPWSAWRIRNHPEKTAADLDALRIEAQHAKDMIASKGWVLLSRWLAAQQATRVNLLAAEPTSEPAEAYALKRAYAAGYLKGLKHAYDTPNALIQIAEEELEWAQKAGERLAREQGDTSE
jgi:hypothetical protein